MKRLCVIAVHEKNNIDNGYLYPVMESFEAAETDVWLLPLHNAFCRHLKRPVKRNLQKLLSDAQAAAYEELILMTDEFMGPVHPIGEMLDLMDQSGKEIWQLTAGAPMYGIPRTLWDELYEAESAEDVFLEMEQKENVSVLYDVSDLADVTDVPLLDKPLTMVRDRKCPFFLHEVFHRDYEKVISTTLGHQGQVFYHWLQKESGWDTDLLWDYLLKNCHQEDYFRNMHLNYVVPTGRSNPKWTEEHLKNHSLALVMHLYYPDKLEESCSFALRFPRETHVIITTSSIEKRQQILQVFSKQEFASLDVRVIGNRGRDVSALLVGAAEVFDLYDYVCFFHDKKTLQTQPGTIGTGFAYKMQENLFATKDYVNNVIRLFSENPRLGMLSPTPPHHGCYFWTLGRKWGTNFQNSLAFFRTMGFSTPISQDKMPIAPLGTCFWFRGSALKPLSDHHWKYEDFPTEPNGIDCTILHAIERIYPFACAEAGYYPAFMISDRYAGIEYSSMRYYVRGFNQICIEAGYLGYHKDMCRNLKNWIQSVKN